MPKIRKVKVANGIDWVEIPEANLYIQCGCPADSVKHLMKRGLIVPHETEGVTYESGPNVILLSDVNVQNESLANMAEFPVLQMLYRQGMILPGHPNNTGVKPMLIGADEQVASQLDYIYRGNYGLISEQEIQEAGVAPELARDMMRLKLKFAFGRIQQTEELLDSRVIKSEPVEIKKGVFVKRIALNKFEFQYQDETVGVNLNLAPQERYEIPYPLGSTQVEREYFAVLHTGEGDGWDINRPCMSSILMFQGKIYLIDAGPNIRKSLMALGIGVNEVEGIFHTHAHDDHFAGLTTLMRADHRIKYYATPLVRSSVIKKLSALLSIDSDGFSRYFDVQDLVFDEWNSIRGLEVKPIFSPHPVETSILIFRTLWEDGYRSYAHFADVVALDVLQGMITKDANEPGVSQSFFDHVKSQYLTPVDLKKIDIGGGLIHGQAEDFETDNSKKIILSHTSQELSVEQKKIGSGASFGSVDILIPTIGEYAPRTAFEILQTYFPDVPQHQMRILMNNPLVTFNPGSILIKDGESVSAIYLVVTGNVEQIASNSDLVYNLTAGAFVGEICGLLERVSSGTFRAAGYVQALRLPANLYREFVQYNGLLEKVKQLHEIREFVQMVQLFGESISSTIQNRLAESMRLKKYRVGHKFTGIEESHIYIVKSGTLQLSIGENPVETLQMGSFFGEDTLFGMPYLFSIETLEPSEIYQIPGDQLLDIPIVHWKLFETLRKRRRLLLTPEQQGLPIFYWRDEFRVKVAELDHQHQSLFEKAHKLYEMLDSDQEKPQIKETLSFLLEYAKTHFKSEENLMKRFKYPELKAHQNKHLGFYRRLLGIIKRLDDDTFDLEIDFLSFLKDWFIDHILTEDKKYAAFFADKDIQ